MSAALGVGIAPFKLAFYDESEGRMASESDMEDSMAKLVMKRFRDARQFKSSNSVYQGKSTVTLLNEADHAMNKVYTCDQIARMTEAFGFCPSRYYGLIHSKVAEITAWKNELVNNDPGSLIKIVPTPNPRLSEASIKAIKETVKQEMVKRMMDFGIGDPAMLVKVGSNRLHPSVIKFLEEKADLLKQVEQARVVSQAMSGSTEAQVLMRDAIIEGDFTLAYNDFSQDQIKNGIGVMRFPYMQRRVIMASRQDGKGKPEREWASVPCFKHVAPQNFFPMNDGRDVSSNTANMEYSEISKATLVGMMKDSRYDSDAIEWILNEYSFRSRTWLFPEASETKSESGRKSHYWSPDEVVAVIYHEGYVTGKDLEEYGLTGYETSKVYSAVVEICCGRAIRVEVKNPTDVSPRSFATTKFDSTGPGIWSAVGVPAILQDTQDRVNILLHAWEHNLDWSLRPPLQTNPDSLKNPAEAMRIRPGGKYEVSDMIGPGVSPDPIRTIRGPSAQYQIVYPLILQLIRQADTEVGVPSLSDFNSLGRGSLGEFSSRVSGAVRRIRNAAFAEDRGLKPLYATLYEHVIEENPEIVDGMDLTFNYIGVGGLLAQEAERKAKQERLMLIMNGAQSGAVPKEVVDFAWQDMLVEMGVPTQALGMSDVLSENAIAIAMQNGSVAPGGGAGAGGLAGAPQLDGRSAPINNVPTAVSQPNGGSQVPGMLPPPAL